MDWQEYIKFPLKDREWLKKLVIGCFILIVPGINILALGYFVQCLQSGIGGKRHLPEWEDWAYLFNDGLAAIIIIVIYLLVPIILTPLLAGVFLVGPLIAAIILLTIGFMVPFALANYAESYHFKRAFNFLNIAYQISRVLNHYIAAYLLIIIITAVGWAVTLGIPLIGFMGIPVIFYSNVVFANFIGLLYREAAYSR